MCLWDMCQTLPLLENNDLEIGMTFKRKLSNNLWGAKPKYYFWEFQERTIMKVRNRDPAIIWGGPPQFRHSWIHLSIIYVFTQHLLKTYYLLSVTVGTDVT